MDWQYLAGFFDGEGSISLSAKKANKDAVIYTVAFSLTNTSRPVLDYVVEFIGFGKVYTKLRDQELNPNSRTVYTYVVTGKRTLMILQGMEPYLIIKKERAQLAIRFIERRLKQKTTAYTDEDFAFVREMRRLNARHSGHGRPITPLPDSYDKRTGWPGQERNRSD